MDSSLKPMSLLTQTLTFFLCFGPFLVKSVSDYNSLVYKDCANQILTNPTESFSQTLSALFQDLVTQSLHSKFFKTAAGDEQNPLFGLFQCRGDLSDEDCYNCVSAIPEISNNLCHETVAARIQLSGCYIQYDETDGLSQENSSEPKLLYKSCKESSNGAVPSGFKEVMGAAFVEVESGVVSSSNGFYATDYESVDVLAQCEGHLGGCDCGECVSNAVVIAQDECGNSVSGEIYMDNCFLSYTYYPDGIPNDSNPGEGSNNNNNNNNSSSTGKTLAIVVGGAAALFLGFLFFVFIKSLAKKGDDS